MVHQYKNNGYDIVLDVNSGAIHVVDDVTYDVIEMIDQSQPESYARDEIVSALSGKYAKDQLDALRQMCKDAAAGSDSIAKSQCDGDDRDIAHRHRFFGNKLDSADHDG